MYGLGIESPASSSASSASEDETDDRVDGDDSEVWRPSPRSPRQARISGARLVAEPPGRRRTRRRNWIHAALVAATVVLGVAVLMWMEKLGFVEALYVTTQIVTTIGYGDITFKEPGMRLFMAFYVLWMLVLVGFFLNSAIQSVIETHAEHMKRYLRRVEQYAEHARLSKHPSLEDQSEAQQNIAAKVKTRYGEINSLIYATMVFLLHLAFGTVFFVHLEHCSCSYGATAVTGCTLENACEVGLKKSYIDAFYMAVVTLTTVGFGDLTPSTWVGRLVGIPWMLSGIVSTAFFLEAMQNVLLKIEARQRFDDAEQMSEETFSAIDRDGNGVLTKAEFVNYSLVKHNLVDQETLDFLSGIFDSMVKSNQHGVSFEEVQEFQERFRARKGESRRESLLRGQG